MLIVTPDLNSLERWGNQVIISLQKVHSKPLDVVNQVLAFAGLGVIYGVLSVGFLLFWDKEIGLHLVSITLLSAVANLSIKFAYVGPRPYWTDSRILALECRTEYAFPSGHSSAPTALLGWLALLMLQRFLQYRKLKADCAVNRDDDALVQYLAEKEIGGFHFRKCRYVSLLWVLTGVWLILISLSRCYLGAHYPHDMWAGILIGVATIIFYRLIVQKVLLPRVWRATLFIQLFFALLASLLGTGLLVGCYFIALRRGFPEIWQEIAELQCKGVNIKPKLSSAMMLSGAFTAVLTGAVCLYQFADFNAARKTLWWKKFLVRPIVFLAPGGAIMGAGLLLQKQFSNNMPVLLSVSWFGAFISCFWITFLAAYFCKWIQSRRASRWWLSDVLLFGTENESIVNVAREEGGDESQSFFIKQTGI